MANHRVVGGLLIRAGLIDGPRLDAAIKGHPPDAGSLGQRLEHLGLASAEHVAETIARGLSLEFLGLSFALPTPEVAALVPPVFRHTKLVAALSVQHQSLRLAMADPLDYTTIRDIEFATGKTVVPVVATRTAVEQLLAGKVDAVITKGYDVPRDADPAGEIEMAPAAHDDIHDLQALANTALPPVVRLINVLLSDAAQKGASDIHVEPQETLLQVRWRIDGVMQDALTIPKVLQDATISRLKIMSGMDIADRRRSQDGRCRLRLGADRLDLRVSTLPTHYGEKVVLRLLDASKSQISLESMEFAPALLHSLRAQLTRPQGMVLVTGPTGSGKTSTLYAALNWLKSSTNNIITVEDPIEYQIAGLNQVQINPKAGVTFASGLRSILRQDPDIILVGEIRDQETAKIALEAAQTGHLLLSTLHTNDATAAVTRLVDLGIEPFLVSSSILGVLAQRLVRRVCPACTASKPPDDATMTQLKGVHMPASADWRAGTGCQACGQTGHKGRLAVHELLLMTNELRDLIGQRSPEHVIRQAARRAGLRTMLEDGIEKAAQGLTTLAEVVRVVPLDAGTETEPAAPEGQPPIVVSTPGTQPVTAAPRVLVVEDSATISSVLKHFLELEGFEVVVCDDGARGLQKACEWLPDIIVSDINMPLMDGVSLVRALRINPATSQTAFIILTSEGSVERETEGLAAGADDYLAKPVDPRRLTARVRALLARTRARRLAVPA